MPKVVALRGTTAIVMSRLPRLIDPDTVWLKGLRASLRRLSAEPTRLLIAPGTAGSEFVRRGAERLGITTETVKCIGTPETAEGAVSERDSVLCQTADRLVVLGLRNNGKWHRLLKQRLAVGRRRVILVDLPGLQPQSVRSELLELGAEEWSPPCSLLLPFNNALNLREITHGCVNTSSPRVTECLISPRPDDPDATILTHTTRACPGPWPEQPVDDYLDSLLDQRPDASHSALHTLIRIIRQRRLIGSSRMIRGAFEMVSFTGVPLDQLPSLRCFRTHRMRWDFEPYGISIRRSAFVDTEIRPVQYGDEALWQTLPESDRPWFQLRNSGGADSVGLTDESGVNPLDVGTDGPVVGSKQPLDWTCEQEWRVRGSLDLTRFRTTDITVIVPDYESAREVARWTDWNVTLCPKPGVQ